MVKVLGRVPGFLRPSVSGVNNSSGTCRHLHPCSLETLTSTMLNHEDVKKKTNTFLRGWASGLFKSGLNNKKDLIVQTVLCFYTNAVSRLMTPPVFPISYTPDTLSVGRSGDVHTRDSALCTNFSSSYEVFHLHHSTYHGREEGLYGFRTGTLDVYSGINLYLRSVYNNS